MRRSWPDLPEIGIWAWPLGHEFRVRIEPPGAAHAPAPPSPAIDSEWQRQCATNPKLFDGPVLSVTGLDPGREIRVRRDSYKRLAVQPAVETGVEQLSVTGIVLSRDARGREHVLLGRRGTQTRIYGGMWELAPSGGIDPPAPDRSSLCEGDLIEQLQREFVEETGIQSPLSALRPHALCQDLHARSCDIVFVCTLERFNHPPITAPDGWEYQGLRWAALAEIRRFESEHGVIPPTRAMFRFLGWV
jgi:hypothetical protein